MLSTQTGGIREICDVVFKARTDLKIGDKTFKKGQPVLYIDTAKTSSLEGQATTVYAQGGKGNPRLIAWDGERTLTFTFEDALISPLSFAMLSGAGVAQASKDNRVRVHTTFDLPILDGGVVKIDLDTADGNHDIYITDEIPAFGMILDGASRGAIPCGAAKVGDNIKENAGVYTITKENALELTFPDAANYVGQTMRVDCYAEKVDGAVEVTIDAKNFAGSYYVEASTLWRDEESAEDFAAEFVIPNAKIQSNFTFSMAPTGDPSTFTFTMDAMPAYTNFDKTKKVFAALQIVGPDSLKEIVEEPVATDAPTLVFDIVGGTSEFGDDVSFSPDGVKFADLGRNLRASVDGSNVDFYGTLKKIPNWTEFSDKPADLTGYYYPFTIKPAEDSEIPSATAIVREQTLGGVKGKEIKIPENIIWAIDPKAPVITVDAIGDGETEQYSFDFSRVNFL